MKQALVAVALLAAWVGVPRQASAMTVAIYPAGERYRDCAVRHLFTRPASVQALLAQLNEDQPILQKNWATAFTGLEAECGRVPNKPMWTDCVGGDLPGPFPDALRVAQLLLGFSDHVQRVATRATWVASPARPPSQSGGR